MAPARGSNNSRGARAVTTRSADGRPESAIEHRRTDDVVVLRPAQLLHESLAGDRRVQALEAHDPVIIDPGRLRMVPRDRCPGCPTSSLLYRPEMCFLCAGVGDRGMLEASGPVGPVAVFDTAGAAIHERSTGRDGWASEAAG
jgi:hypothetical protein